MNTLQDLISNEQFSIIQLSNLSIFPHGEYGKFQIISGYEFVESNFQLKNQLLNAEYLLISDLDFMPDSLKEKLAEYLLNSNITSNSYKKIFLIGQKDITVNHSSLCDKVFVVR